MKDSDRLEAQRLLQLAAQGFRTSAQTVFDVSEILGTPIEMKIVCPEEEDSKAIKFARVEEETASQAFLRFEMSLDQDVEVYIDDGTGEVQLGNTGVFSSHNYPIHNQTTLSASTAYTLRLVTADQEDCFVTFMTTNSEIFTFDTYALAGGNFAGNRTNKGNGETLVTFTPFSSNGINPKVDLLKGQLGYWLEYEVFIPDNFDPTSNVKGPGFSSLVTGGPATGIGGQGGGGSGDDLAFSARIIIHRRGTTFSELGLAWELYHDQSTNAPFGQTIWWGNGGANSTSPTPEASLISGQWNKIKMFMRLNTVGLNDGELRGWINGSLQSIVENVGFTDDNTTTDGDPDATDPAAWMNFYIGGSADTSGNTNTVCLRNERYAYGLTDLFG